MVDSLEREKLIFDQSINAKDGAIDEDVDDAARILTSAIRPVGYFDQ